MRNKCAIVNISFLALLLFACGKSKSSTQAALTYTPSVSSLNLSILSHQGKDDNQATINHDNLKLSVESKDKENNTFLEYVICTVKNKMCVSNNAGNYQSLTSFSNQETTQRWPLYDLEIPIPKNIRGELSAKARLCASKNCGKWMTSLFTIPTSSPYHETFFAIALEENKIKNKLINLIKTESNSSLAKKHPLHKTYQKLIKENPVALQKLLVSGLSPLTYRLLTNTQTLKLSDEFVSKDEFISQYNKSLVRYFDMILSFFNYNSKRKKIVDALKNLGSLESQKEEFTAEITSGDKPHYTKLIVDGSSEVFLKKNATGEVFKIDGNAPLESKVNSKGEVKYSFNMVPATSDITTKSAINPDILIVGAGPIGLLTALRAKKEDQGKSIKILEKRSAATRKQVLKVDLTLYTEINEFINSIPEPRKTSLNTLLDEKFFPVEFQSSKTVAIADLQDILEQVVNEKIGQDTILKDHELIRNSDPSKPLVVDSKGNIIGVDTRVIVAADGASSATREVAGIKRIQTNETSGEVGYVLLGNDNIGKMKAYLTQKEYPFFEGKDSLYILKNLLEETDIPELAEEARKNQVSFENKEFPLDLYQAQTNVRKNGEIAYFLVGDAAMTYNFYSGKGVNNGSAKDAIEFIIDPSKNLEALQVKHISHMETNHQANSTVTSVTKNDKDPSQNMKMKEFKAIITEHKALDSKPAAATPDPRLKSPVVKVESVTRNILTLPRRPTIKSNPITIRLASSPILSLPTNKAFKKLSTSINGLVLQLNCLKQMKNKLKTKYISLAEIYSRCYLD